eukprot:1181096-Rhodomonas_salina.4
MLSALALTLRTEANHFVHRTCNCCVVFVFWVRADAVWCLCFAIVQLLAGVCVLRGGRAGGKERQPDQISLVLQHLGPMPPAVSPLSPRPPPRLSLRWPLPVSYTHLTLPTICSV